MIEIVYKVKAIKKTKIAVYQYLRKGENLKLWNWKALFIEVKWDLTYGATLKKLDGGFEATE